MPKIIQNILHALSYLLLIITRVISTYNSFLQIQKLSLNDYNLLTCCYIQQMYLERAHVESKRDETLRKREKTDEVI